MITLEKFKKLNIDTSSIGWEQTDKEAGCFCTPKGAKIIGRAGVDGIHYCIVRGLGDTIFAISPMNLPGRYVHPIARNFEDFLRLLLACLDLNLIEQAWMWDKDQLNERIDAVRSSDYFDETPLAAIREKCGLTPMENPFRYLYSVQNSFDYGSIPFTKEYYETVDDTEWIPPAWKVTVDGDFFPERGEAGREIVLNKTFLWGNKTWHVPSAYLCKGQVVAVDFFVQIDPEEYLTFRRDAEAMNNRGNLTEEDEEKLRRMNPAGMMIRPTVSVNGTELQSCRSRGEVWIPQIFLDYLGASENEDIRAKATVEHYGFDTSKIYVIRRCMFPHKEKFGGITSMCLTMMGEAETYPGIHFADPKLDDTFIFTHPIYNTEHTLTVAEYEVKAMESHKLSSDEWIFPTHFAVLRYTVTPELPQDGICVRDCSHGDSPRRKETAPKPDCDFCSAIGVIRSSDGPTVVTVGIPQEATAHSTCSSLYFEKPSSIEWRISFRVKTVEDKKVELL